ncbi:GNAT family N-acetyltransferase [Mesobacillus foraminis]|uniref:Acetyltransferase (GNAT) family protein n=1 Tax=Mesobacillus foraminis TaxID=279826 RepID=A0A4R2BE50_9BACI|nr:GNAT family N-acetyltransferase [Mesobacillus foraminis]TCN25211.1 acetyltransferase (GNAT) family protein [Mesobacillus foraminis]
MEIRLEKAVDRDAEAIFDIQVRAFIPLLDKYKDYDTNPANEKLDKVRTRINNPDGGFYKILFGDVPVGAICVYWREETEFWISPMFILPEYQGKGIAQKAIRLMEELFPQATTWELRTILQEKRNCYLYEKMGYKLVKWQHKLNEKATLVHYKKVCLLETDTRV